MHDPLGSGAGAWYTTNIKTSTAYCKCIFCAMLCCWQTDNECSPISAIFRGQICSILHQLGQKESATLQSFFTLQLDVQVWLIACCTHANSCYILATWMQLQLVEESFTYDFVTYGLLPFGIDRLTASTCAKLAHIVYRCCIYRILLS